MDGLSRLCGCPGRHRPFPINRLEYERDRPEPVFPLLALHGPADGSPGSMKRTGQTQSMDHDQDTDRPFRLPDLNADLGLGGAVAEGSAERFLNRDGSFNVVRQNSGIQGLNLYSELLTVSWGRFFGLMAFVYMAVNATFAVWYDALGSSALSHIDSA